MENGIGYEQAQALVAVLREHATLRSLCGNKGDETHLDTSRSVGQNDGVMLAPEMVANEALTTFTFGDPVAVADRIVGRSKMNSRMTEADLSNQSLGPSEAIFIAAFLPQCR